VSSSATTASLSPRSGIVGATMSSSRVWWFVFAIRWFVKVPGFAWFASLPSNDWDDAPASRKLSSIEGALAGGNSEPSYGIQIGTATGAFFAGPVFGAAEAGCLITAAKRIVVAGAGEDNVIFLDRPTGIHQDGNYSDGGAAGVGTDGIRTWSAAGESASCRTSRGERR